MVAEVGPELRLQYLNQPLGEFLHIGVDVPEVATRTAGIGASLPSAHTSANDRKPPIVLKKSGLSSFAVERTGTRRHDGERRVGSDRCGRGGNRKQLGKFTEVLSGGGEMELVAGAAWPT